MSTALAQRETADVSLFSGATPTPSSPWLPT